MPQKRKRKGGSALALAPAPAPPAKRKAGAWVTLPDRGLGVELCLADMAVMSADQIPSCAHGPTLLFEQFLPGGHTTRYFACSASRDRKACPFYQELTAAGSTGKRRGAVGAASHTPPSKGPPPPVDGALAPTLLLAPREDDKTNAQYFFSPGTTAALVTMLTARHRRILCVGCPRLHEALVAASCDSFLLDLDDRFAAFHPPSHYARFNMFNGHFFGPSALALAFAATADLIVCDPPFGGLMPALHRGLGLLLQTAQAPAASWPHLALIMPYFLEKKVCEAFPQLSMTDYQVNYANHGVFRAEAPRASAVRLFSDIPGPDLVLPAADGYRWCAACARYVGRENHHCRLCGVCPSKDGRMYVHCVPCGHCVKPGRQHCTTCRRCLPAGHECLAVEHAGAARCHKCGSPGHRRKDCHATVL